MSEWRGCRGLDPAVAAQVTNAMPPYLIGIESVSPNPFSATNRATWQHPLNQPLPSGTALDGSRHLEGDLRERTREPTIDNAGFVSKATCWEILTVRLGRYASEMARKGTVLTDEMLQQQARQIVYGDDDTWNQSPADNPEWLDLFKKAHGLDFIPYEVGGEGAYVPEDLETYGDLGLRIPFAVQLQAYNQSQITGEAFGASAAPAVYKEALAKKVGHFRDLYASLLRQGKLHDEDYQCGHEKCRNNKADMSWLDHGDASQDRSKRWCTHEVGTELIKPLTIITTTAGNRLAESMATPSGLESLERLSNRMMAAGGNPCPEDNAFTEIAGARAGGLKRLSITDTEHCSSRFPDCFANGSGADSRARSLEALAQIEAPLIDPLMSDLGGPRLNKPYLPRHKLVLPPDRAQRFASTTGPWVDSGVMPEPIYYSHSNTEAAINTSTGAMIEFLGGDVGRDLPFSNDVQTLAIPGPFSSNYDWMVAEGIPVDNDYIMQDLDDLIAATTTTPLAPADPGIPYTTWDYDSLAVNTEPQSRFSMPPMPASTQTTASTELAMEHLDFDDMTFDPSFDLPIDESFMPENNMR